MLSRAFGPARGSRPPAGPLTLNRDSARANGLLALWPLQTDPRNLVARDVGSVSGTVAFTASGDLPGAVIGSAGAYVALPWNTAIWPTTQTMPFSLSLWFATSQSTSLCLIGARGGGGQLYLGSQSTTSLLWYQGGNVVNPTVSGLRDGRMHQLLISSNGNLADASGAKLYVDGLFVASATPANSVAFGTDVRAGTDQGGTGDTLSGAIGHIGLWNRELQANEVWALYDPDTRWDWYWVGRRLYVDVPAAATGWNPLLSDTRNRLVM